MTQLGNMGYRKHRNLGTAGRTKPTTTPNGGVIQLMLLWNEEVVTTTSVVTQESGDEGELEWVTQWGDQSGLDNHAVQDDAEKGPLKHSDGSLDFKHYGDDTSFADYMQFTKFRVTAETPFSIFLVCNLDGTSTNCYLSDSGSEVLQFTSGNAHQTKMSGTVSNMTHSDIFTIDTGRKFLFNITRETDNSIRMYKNGLLCNGHNDEETISSPMFDLENLGVKNAASPGNFFDGKMYDVIVMTGTVDDSEQTRKEWERYLLKKHGLEQLN